MLGMLLRKEPGFVTPIQTYTSPPICELIGLENKHIFIPTVTGQTQLRKLGMQTVTSSRRVKRGRDFEGFDTKVTGCR